MANPFVHIELATTDLGKAKEFYGQLLNWKMSEMEMAPGDPYVMIDPEDDDGVGGGMMKHPMPSEGSGWLPYVAVDDVRAATAKAKSLGATIIRDYTEIPNMGAFSVIVDPTGAEIGLWESAAD